MSMSRTRTLVRTRPPPSRRMRAAAFSSGNPLVPRTPATGQSRPVVAKAVKKTATPERMNCERKGLTEPPREEDPEGLGLNATHPVDWHCDEGRRRQWASEATLSEGRGGGP